MSGNMISLNALQIKRTIEEIRNILRHSGDRDKILQYSSEMVEVAEYINRRLVKIQGYINKNDLILCFCEVERDPNIIDILSAVSFPEASAWREFCIENELPVAEEIDAKIGQAIIQAILPKNDDTKNALYSYYREALFTNDYVKAYHLIKSIIRNFPIDKASQQESERIGGAVTEIYQARLKEVCQTNDAQLIRNLVAEIYDLNIAEIRSGPVWKKALAISVEIEITKLAQVYKSLSINALRNNINRVNIDCRRYGLALSDSIAPALSAIVTHLSELEKNKKIIDESNDARQKLVNFIENIKLDQGSDCDEAGALELTLTTLTTLKRQALKSNVHPSDKVFSEVSSVEERISKLTERILVRKRRVKAVRLISTAVAVFLVSAIISYEMISQSKYKNLKIAVEKNDFLVIDSTFNLCNRNGLGLYARATRRHDLEKVRALLMESQRSNDQINDNILALDKMLREPFSIKTSSSCVKMMAQSHGLITNRVFPYREATRVKLNQLSSKLEEIIHQQSSKIESVLQREIAVITKSVGIDPNRSFTNVQNDVNQLRQSVNCLHDLKDVAEYFGNNSYLKRVNEIVRDDTFTQSVARAERVLIGWERFLAVWHSIQAAKTFNEVRKSVVNVIGDTNTDTFTKEAVKKFDPSIISDRAFARAIAGLKPIGNLRELDSDKETGELDTYSRHAREHLSKILRDPVLIGKSFVYEIKFANGSRTNEVWSCNDGFILDGAVRQLTVWRSLNFSPEVHPSEISFSYVSKAEGISTDMGEDLKSATLLSEPVTKPIIDYLKLRIDLNKRPTDYPEMVLGAIGKAISSDELPLWLRIYIYNALFRLVEMEPYHFAFSRIDRMKALQLSFHEILDDLDDYGSLVAKTSNAVIRDKTKNLFQNNFKLGVANDALVRKYIFDSVIRDGVEIEQIADGVGFNSVSNEGDAEKYFVFNMDSGNLNVYRRNDKVEPYSVLVKTRRSISEYISAGFPNINYTQSDIIGGKNE